MDILNNIKSNVKYIIYIMDAVLIFLQFTADILDKSYCSDMVYNIIILILVSAFIILLLCKKDDTNYKIPKLKESAKNKHPIIVIDDHQGSLDRVSKILEDYGYVVSVNSDIRDYKMVEKYEIIISDIRGMGKLKEVTNILKAIKKNYPYKIIIPMSAVASDLDVGEKVIRKDETYAERIAEKVVDYQNKLNDSVEFWKEIERRIPEDRDTVLRFKKKYIEYVNEQNGNN